jgi:hypothetical protein
LQASSTIIELLGYSSRNNQTDCHFNWNSNDIDLPIINEFSISKGSSTASLGPTGNKLFIGDATKVITRDSAQDAVINLNVVQSQRFAYSCVGYVPRVPPPSIATAKIVGKWCNSNVSEEWASPGEDQFYITNLKCSSELEKRMANNPFTPNFCENFKKDLMSGPVQFNALSSNEFEIRWPAPAANDIWFRYRMTTPSRLQPLNNNLKLEWNRC